LVIDGFAVSMAGVSWAASLDARPAIPARLAMLAAVAASSASNGVWAYLRAAGDGITVALGVAVPVAATLAFEVLLAELRRQVQRRRGLPAPVAVPYPRLIRLLLAPWRTVREWRDLVLALTELTPAATVAELPATVLHGAAAVAAAAETPPEPAPSQAPSPSRPTTPSAQTLTQLNIPARHPTNIQQHPTAPDRIERQAARTAAPAAPATTKIETIAGPLTEPTPEPATPPRSAPRRAPAPRRAAATPRPTMAAEKKPRSATLEAQDPRVVELAVILAGHEDPERITGEMVGPLLRAEIAPRTGRRLLGQARELLKTAA
jgi:hypothetical protein